MRKIKALIITQIQQPKSKKIVYVTCSEQLTVENPQSAKIHNSACATDSKKLHRIAKLETAVEVDKHWFPSFLAKRKRRRSEATVFKEFKNKEWPTTNQLLLEGPTHFLITSKLIEFQCMKRTHSNIVQIKPVLKAASFPTVLVPLLDNTKAETQK